MKSMKIFVQIKQKKKKEKTYFDVQKIFFVHTNHPANYNIKLRFRNNRYALKINSSCLNEVMRFNFRNIN